MRKKEKISKKMNSPQLQREQSATDNGSPANRWSTLPLLNPHQEFSIKALINCHHFAPFDIWVRPKAQGNIGLAVN